MRTFIIKNIIDTGSNEDLLELSTLYNTQIEVIPKIGDMFNLNGDTYRCIEHKIGKITLKSDKFILRGIEKNPVYVI
jgi:hypothetical protein